MATLDDYETLVAIMETGSLTAAAWRLGRSLQSFRIGYYFETVCNRYGRGSTSL